MKIPVKLQVKNPYKCKYSQIHKLCNTNREYAFIEFCVPERPYPSMEWECKNFK